MVYWDTAQAGSEEGCIVCVLYLLSYEAVSVFSPVGFRSVPVVSVRMPVVFA